MSRRTLLILSLLLNLLLLAGLALPRKPASPEGSSEPATPLVHTVVVQRAGAEPSAPVVTTNTAVIPFHWRELESEDYAVYAERLRATGCPERIVTRLLVADIEEHYRKLWREDGRQPRPHWQTAAQRREWDRQRAARDEARYESARALQLKILGHEIPGQELYDWETASMTHALLGFLPDEKIDHVVGLITGAMGDSQRLKEKRQQVLLAEDRAALQKNYDTMQSRLAGLLNITELEEFNLRLGIIKTAFDGNHVAGVDLTAAEMRQLARIQIEAGDVIRDELLAAQPRQENEAREREKMIEARVRELLGEERFADYQRAQDAKFREIFEFTRDASLPKSVAIAVHDVRKAADQQAGAIRKDKQLTPEQRQQTLAAIGAETERTLRAALGNSFPKFRDANKGWFNGFQSPPPPKP